jgi:hypothetical protein
VISFVKKAASCELQAASHKLRASSYKLQATSYKLQAVSKRNISEEDEQIRIILKSLNP